MVEGVEGVEGVEEDGEIPVDRSESNHGGNPSVCQGATFTGAFESVACQR